jgi:hypothetical protein
MAVGEWDQRQLCSDGACIGVIGPEGTCKVCGRAAPNWGDERNRGLIDPSDDEEEDEEEDLAADEDEGDDDDEDDDDDDDDNEEYEEEDDDDDGDEPDEPSVAAAPRGAWSGRQLCPDGGCIGVIGPDGRCKVCGRRAAGAPAEPPSSEPAAVAATAAAADPGPPASAATPEHAPGTGPLGEFLAGATAAPAAASGPEPCPTAGCSGHIGSDGRCAVCGKGAS